MDLPQHPLELLHPRSLKFIGDELQLLVRTKLWAQILVGMALGIGLGVLLGPTVGWVSPASATTIGNWVALPGHLFLRLVQMIVVALVVSSIIRGIAGSEDMCRTAINVAGDLTACVVMDKWVGGQKTQDEELAAQAAREERRKESGEDVIMGAG